MPPSAKWALLYWGAISAVAVVLTVWDKHRARMHRFRVREATLLTVAALGGAAAMWLTMKLIRHKTRKPKFMVSLPLLICLHAALVLFAAWRGGFLF